MSKNEKKFFSSQNKLDINVILHILKFISHQEINILAGLKYYSESKEIKNEFYNQQLLNIELGKCLMIYSWNDWFWKEMIKEKIIRINKFLQLNFVKTHLSTPPENFRAMFTQEIWNKIGDENWKRIQKRRSERKLYFRSIPKMITEISQHDTEYKNAKSKQLILNMIDQKQCYVDHLPSHITLKETLELGSVTSYGYYMKWVSVGSNVGKTCLFIRASGNYFPQEFIPTVFDGYSATISLKHVLDGKEVNSSCSIGFWDTVCREEYDRLRPLSYPDTTVYTMAYAINDWSSLQYLVEHLLWECIHCSPKATFVVISTKNDLKEKAYWISLFDSSVEEPISKEEGIEFTKAIGAISFIETSAKTGQGVSDIIHKLVCARHTHLKYLESTPKTQSKKSCAVQ